MIQSSGDVHEPADFEQLQREAELAKEDANIAFKSEPTVDTIHLVSVPVTCLLKNRCNCRSGLQHSCGTVHESDRTFPFCSVLRQQEPFIPSN